MAFCTQVITPHLPSMKAFRFPLSSLGDVGSERAIAERMFERLRQEYAGRATLGAYS